MYSVSSDYLDIIQHSLSIKRKISGSIGGVPFTSDDILAGSFSYSGQIVDKSDIRLGGVFIQTVKFSFLKSFSDSIDRGTWKGRVIEVSIGLFVNNDYEYVPLGTFTVDDAMHSATGVDITAYCNMSKFDTSRGLSTNTTGTFYEILSLACLNAGVTLGMTQAEVEAMPNGTGTRSMYSPNDCETWRDVISWIACTMCGYATIDREGQLVIKTWGDTSEMNVSQDNRFNDGLYSDFETYYTGISVVNMKTEMTEYLGMPVDDGLTMNLGSNPFMQYGTESYRTEMKQNILNALQNFRYVPFSVSTFLDPAFDLGDVLIMAGGRASNSKVCVMSIEYSFQNGLKLKGFGSDPALANARSKTDKNISGLLSKTDSKSIQYYSFINAKAYEDIAEEETIGKFRFATVEDTTVTLWHEIKLDCNLDDEDTPMQVVVHYYLNEVEERYTPVMTIGESGVHTLDYNYFLAGISGGLVNDWRVTVECIGGTADIDAGDVHILLAGQGLVSNDEFLGYIDATDDIEALAIAGLNVSAFSETVSCRKQPLGTVTLDPDDVSAYDIPDLAVVLEEQSALLQLVYNDNHIAYAGEGLYCGEDISTGGENILA